MISEQTRNDIDLALRKADLKRASSLAAAAVTLEESDPKVVSLAAFGRQQAGDAHGASELFRRAVELAPDDPNILAQAADALRFTGQLQEAIGLFDRALSVDPDMVAAWYGRALALDASGVIEEAKASYRRVCELAPSASAGFAGLASMHAVLGELELARENVARAERLGISDPASVIALARCNMALKDADAAARTLERIVKRLTADSMDRVVALGLLGDSLDRLKRFDEAFAAYEEANQVFARLHAGHELLVRPKQLVETIDRAVEELDPPAFRWAVEPPEEPRRHIFLLGFPRSGNTLVEQILATIPDVVTLEEAPTLMSGADYLTAEGIARLANASEDELETLRADYWARVAAEGVDVTKKSFVDMDPLKGPALPLIARLFPHAKVVFIQRDARDVVWSCFRHSFVSSQVATEFTSLQRTADYYATMMRLITNCLERFRVSAFTMSYEELVRDFERTTRRLCDFLDLHWSPELHHFDRTARNRPVKTASSRQVQQKLFDGSGRWQGYADKLEPVLDTLRPWIRTP
jgi:tetratricopeptide (TPR) repeat protein